MYTVHANPSKRRRAAVAILVAVLLPVLLGLAALTLDLGAMYNTQADLQNAADAGALAATETLGRERGSNAVQLAREAALAIVEKHRAMGRSLTIDPAVDLVFGKVDYDAVLNAFSFTPTEFAPDGVQINIRATQGSPNGATPLFFAGIFGKSFTNMAAPATAALTGLRDMAVVIDLSGSMKHDSYLRFYTRAPINARDVWASLDGPEPSRPYIPGAENETEYAGDTGPTIGVMSTWGNSITPVGSYNPLTDPGLWYIPSGAACTEADITASLTARGYTAAQRTSIMSGPAATWANRTAVMIGVATWTPSGAGDATVNSAELTWIPYPPYRKTWTWAEYVDWTAGNNNKLTPVHPEFRYQFGLKTYVDFLLDRKDNFSQTDLAKTPEEPIRSVKDGLQEMVNNTRSFDHMSLEIFASTARHEIDLSGDRQAVADRLYEMQPNHYDNSTNIGAGLQMGIDELTGPRAREDAKKIIVLMSDGASTIGPDPESVAQDAADLGITVYAISVGYIADRDTMIAIAEITGGEEFYAVGTPEEYTAELQVIFRTIAGLGFAQLIE